MGKKSGVSISADQKDANIGEFFILLVDSNSTNTGDEDGKKTDDLADMNDSKYPSSVNQRIREELKIDNA